MSSLYSHVTSSKRRVVCTVIVLCRCGLWLDVNENSQGEEPFISQAAAITEACSHRHNHLLELLEIGSPKWYGLRVHQSIQDNFYRCHSSESNFSVLVESLRNKRSALWCPLAPEISRYFLLLLSYKMNSYMIATVIFVSFMPPDQLFSFSVVFCQTVSHQTSLAGTLIRYACLRKSHPDWPSSASNNTAAHTLHQTLMQCIVCHCRHVERWKVSVWRSWWWISM